MKKDFNPSCPSTTCVYTDCITSQYLWFSCTKWVLWIDFQCILIVKLHNKVAKEAGLETPNISDCVVQREGREARSPAHLVCPQALLLWLYCAKRKTLPALGFWFSNFCTYPQACVKVQSWLKATFWQSDFGRHSL